MNERLIEDGSLVLHHIGIERLYQNTLTKHLDIVLLEVLHVQRLDGLCIEHDIAMHVDVVGDNLREQLHIDVVLVIRNEVVDDF